MTGTKDRPMAASYEIICAEARTPPSNGYFEPEDHPARTTLYTANELIARKNKTPTLISAPTIFINCDSPPIARSKPGPKGMIIKIRKDGTKAIIGAKRYIALSAFIGNICSFNNSFIASASVCRIPKGPARSGPTLDCIPATTFLSSQIKSIVLVSKSPNPSNGLINARISSTDT